MAKKAKVSTEKVGSANETMPEKSAYFSKDGTPEPAVATHDAVDQEKVCEAEDVVEKSSYFLVYA